MARGGVEGGDKNSNLYIFENTVMHNKTDNSSGYYFRLTI